MHEKKPEVCALCGCKLHRGKGSYAKPTPEGRSSATNHHFVAERLFGRTKNKGTKDHFPVFKETDPWGLGRKRGVFCCECHELLLHNPVFTRENIKTFKKLVKAKGLNEDEKPADANKIARRIELLQQVVEAGMNALLKPQGKNEA